MKTLIVVSSDPIRQAMQRVVPAVGVMVTRPDMGVAVEPGTFDLVLMMAPMRTPAEQDWFEAEVRPAIAANGDMYALWDEG